MQMLSFVIQLTSHGHTLLRAHAGMADLGAALKGQGALKTNE